MYLNGLNFGPSIVTVEIAAHIEAVILIPLECLDLNIEAELWATVPLTL